MKTNHEIIIRLANKKDAEAIATIHVLSWQKIYRGYIPDNILDSLCILERKKRWQALPIGDTAMESNFVFLYYQSSRPWDLKKLFYGF